MLHREYVVCLDIWRKNVSIVAVDGTPGGSRLSSYTHLMTSILQHTGMLPRGSIQTRISKNINTCNTYQNIVQVSSSSQNSMWKNPNQLSEHIL